ncbi:MAG: beta-ketoacyl-ACP synthase II [Bdellovibrionales bacterium]|nr:beta-ketoacyl-ACP synthase II [Bdellovibrionales bacterium]
MGSENIFLREQKSQRRVVVTGIAMITPLGSDTESSWKNLIEGQSGIGPITFFDTEKFDVKIAGEVKGFNVDDFVPKKEQKKMDRFIHLALGATSLALKDSKLELTDQIKSSTGTFIGVGMGGLPLIEKNHTVCMERGPSRISPFFIPGVITNLASGQVSIAYGFKGPNFSITSACASGAHAIGEAARYIRDGLCDVMVAGGSESVVSEMAIGGFSSMKALSTRNSQPEAASRPWDKGRDGFVLSEGSAILILEDYEHAMKRDAHIYCELTGYGMSSDAYHMTNPSPGGAGAAQAMAIALADAKLNAQDIDYINAHGTSTPVGDEIETQAIKAVFKDHAKKLWVSSTKSMTGHTLGAAGAIESVISILALNKSIVPPTINLENPSDDCDLDYVPLTTREKSLKHVLNNSFGFGGTNACLVFSKI